MTANVSRAVSDWCLELESKAYMVKKSWIFKLDHWQAVADCTRISPGVFPERTSSDCSSTDKEEENEAGWREAVHCLNLFLKLYWYFYFYFYLHLRYWTQLKTLCEWSVQEEGERVGEWGTAVAHSPPLSHSFFLYSIHGSWNTNNEEAVYQKISGMEKIQFFKNMCIMHCLISVKFWGLKKMCTLCLGFYDKLCLQRSKEVTGLR